ncbi:hypothetical protein JEQ12_002701 [Ovis aries]|uniref:Uncharacterized protein n=1 Tax=Ovis aries TaxID=9940 RepID=A0A836A6L6_SHEEP|nr:hypothetical protein JEQ12_002701 [Ovis aries]
MTALSTTQKESDKEGGSGRSPSKTNTEQTRQDERTPHWAQVHGDENSRKTADLDSVGLANFRLYNRSEHKTFSSKTNTEQTRQEERTPHWAQVHGDEKLTKDRAPGFSRVARGPYPDTPNKRQGAKDRQEASRVRKGFQTRETAYGTADLDSVGLANFRTEILLLAPDLIQMPCAFTKWEKEIAFPRNKIGVCMGQQKVCSSPPTLNMLELLAHSDEMDSQRGGKKSSPDMQTKYSRLTVRQIQSVKAR